MKVEQIYTGCLAQGAYYIESNGEIAIIDPLREVTPYIEKASKDGGKIKYIFETHFHADFVSGHLELHKQTGAQIIFGPDANPSFEAISATDGQEFKLGNVTIKVLHTPGHTLESSCYLLLDENNLPHSIFTGDTLFIGDVGRPDLAIKSDLTKEDLAGMLYDSLRSKIRPLPDNITVYPAHGAGSACGKNMSKETSDTLGHQKEVNYALQDTLSRDEFIKELTTGILPAPFYFPKNAMLNKTGAGNVDSVMEHGLKPLTVAAFEALAEEHALVIDTRKPQVFKDAFIPKAINIGIDGDFAPWVGTLVTDINQLIIFIADEGREEEVVKRLARVGYDHVAGYLQGGIEAWKAAGKETDSIISISAEEFAARNAAGKLFIADVRKLGEYDTQHVKEAHSIPLNFINNEMESFSKNETNYIHCAGGYRSMIASSILKARGVDNIVEVAGGFGAIKKTDVPLVSEVAVA